MNIGKDIVVEVKKPNSNRVVYRYFLIEEEPIYLDNSYVRLLGRFLSKAQRTERYVFDYRYADDNEVLEKVEDIKIVGTKKQLMPEITIEKFTYNKDFVKAFKDNCKADKINYSDFIRDSIKKFIEENSK